MTTDIDYSFTDYLFDLWRLFEVREGMSVANAARTTLDLREEALLAYLQDIPVQDFFDEIGENE